MCWVCVRFLAKDPFLQIRLDDIHAGGNGPRRGARGRKSSLDLDVELVGIRALCYSKKTRTHHPDNVLIPVLSIQKNTNDYFSTLERESTPSLDDQKMTDLKDDTAAAPRKPFANIELDDDDDDVDDNEEGLLQCMVQHKKPTKKKKSNRRRRRSSARFLKLSSVDVDDDDDDDEEEAQPESEQLGELYKRAIRMNAENRINAGNSWNLRLIENMDKLIVNDANDTNNGDGNSNESSTGGTGVNFTKASCTLDASVKIYSYRVDDVHLTSYKVLANLNRNDATEKKVKKTSSATTDNGEMMDGDDANDDEHEERTKERKSAETLETNLGKLLLMKLLLMIVCICIDEQSRTIVSHYLFHFQPISISTNSIRPMILIHSFTKCQRPLMKVVPKDCCLSI